MPTTTQPPTTVGTTVSAVSGAPLGAATITETQASQLLFTPAVPSTPYVDPTGLITSNLIRAEVNKIIEPLKREIKTLKVKIEKLESRNKELEKRQHAEEDREKERIETERKRINAENLRVARERERVNAEKKRVDAEKARVVVGGSAGASGAGASQQIISDLERKITRIEDDVKELQSKNTQLNNELNQAKNEIAQVRSQAPAAPLHTNNPVREWKRRACEEVLGLTAPAGKAPLVKATANNSYSCCVPTCTFFTNRRNCLDTYIKHLKDKHQINMRDVNLSIALRNTYLPR